MKVKVAGLCLTLCNSMDYTVHEILQARIPEWVAVPLLQGIFPTQVYIYNNEVGVSHVQLNSTAVKI